MGQPYSFLVWVWDGQTDRQSYSVASWLLTEGHKEWKCICRDEGGTLRGGKAQGPRSRGVLEPRE